MIETPQQRIEEISDAFDRLSVSIRRDAGIELQQSAHDALREIISKPCDTDFSSEVLEYFDSKEMTFRIREASGSMYARQEEAAFLKLPANLSLETLLEDDLYLSEMLQLSLKEYTLADFGAARVRVFIGCGPIPLTPVAWQIFDVARAIGRLETLHSLAGEYPSEQINPEAATLLRNLARKLPAFKNDIQTICLEQKPELVEKAVRFIEALNIKNIHVVQSDAQVFNYPRNIDRVAFAGVVSNKADILNTYLNTNDQQTQALVTMRLIAPNTLGELLYEPFGAKEISVLNQAFPRFRCLGEHPPAMSPEIYATTGVYES